MSSSLQETISALSAIPVEGRRRTNITDTLKASGLTREGLLEHGLTKDVPFHDSYGRGLVHEVPGIHIPQEMELLAVTVHPGYAPAIHTHGPGTAGANIYAADGTFYNVDYHFVTDERGNELLQHKGLQKIPAGEVAYVPGNNIHRVMNPFEEQAASLNVYWDNGNLPGEVGDKAYVYDFVEGTRVTSGGPAFFFVDGADKQEGFRGSALVQVEDIVFQHYQLVTAREHGQLPPEREPILEKLETMLESAEMNTLANQARIQAQQLVKSVKGEHREATQEYMDLLFDRLEKLTGREQAPSSARSL